MTVYLVRHGQAVHRAEWRGDDEERPLTGLGARQAESIADRLADAGIKHIVSSPSRRCVDTLVPLAERLGLDVATDVRLAEGSAFEDALELLAELGDDAALCSHGEMIPEVIDALVRRGMTTDGPPDWRKASVWTITVEGGQAVHATSWPPPDRPPI